ncbi:MAG: NAD(P)H-dependent oxidoreductase [Planctomycetia bacterium]|nr:NAD(P)H-dependent oxidoreductase [Planctomycetia bacterium]
MHILLVLGHPNPKDSFNRAVAQTVHETLCSLGHEVVFHDLYAEKFDPVMTYRETLRDGPVPRKIQPYVEEVLAADGYVFVHPNWWGGPPAILRGFLDRVFRSGLVYSFGDTGVVSKIAGRRGMVLSTSNTPRDVEVGIYNDPLENFWKNVFFGMLGIEHENFRRRNFESVILSTPEQRKRWLEQAQDLTEKMFARDVS